MRMITTHEWMGFLGALSFPDGTPPRVKELEIVDEGNKYEALMIVSAESVQIHWVRDLLCSQCSQQDVHSRYVTHRLYDGDVGSPAPTPEVGELLASQLVGQANEIQLKRLGFYPAETC